MGLSGVYLIASLLSGLFGAYFIARAVELRLQHKRKWIRFPAALAVLAAAFVAISLGLSWLAETLGFLEFGR